MKKIHLFKLCVIALALTACSENKEVEKTEQTVRVEKTVLAGGEQDVEYPGKVKAAEDVNLAFRVSGTINRYCVAEGATVRKGQLLVELDPADYQVQLDATKAEYQQVKAEAERVMSLYDDKVTTPNDNDKAVYGLKRMEAKLKHHQDQLAYTKIYAPFDGCIQKHLFDSHETVGAGTPVVSMISNGNNEVEINIPAKEYVNRSKFSCYQCTFSIYPDVTYDLRLLSISPKANSNQLYTMRLQLLTGGKPKPAPGMNTMVKIRCSDSNESRLIIPGSSILKKDGKCYVFAYQASDKTVRSHEVNILSMLSDGRCIISASGIGSGVQVVSAGVHHISDGEKVRLLPEKTETNVGGLL